MRWRVNWEDPYTKRSETLHFETEAEAEAKWIEIKNSINRGAYVDPKAGFQLCSEYGDAWVQRLVMRDSSRATIESRWRNHVRPVLGDKPIGAIHPSAIQYWVRSRQQLNKPLAASTIRTIYNTVVFPMFRQAVIDEARVRSPCIGIKLPELPRGVYDLPTAEQVLAIHEALPEQYKVVPLLAAGCGWRSGEIWGAEYWGDPKHDRTFEPLWREAHVVQQLNELSGVGLRIAFPKSKTSYRTNEVPTLTGLGLAHHIGRFPPLGQELLDVTNPDKPTTREARLLIVDHRGLPMRSQEWTRIWNRATDDAGLPRGMFTLRSLRHYFATVLIFDGASVKAVQLACGHATPIITLNTYLGYWPGDERLGTRKLLDSALGGAFCTGSVPSLTS